MKNLLRSLLAALALVVGLGLLSACSTDEDVVSQNLSEDADNFKISRRVVFVNGITDEYLLEVQGLCNINDDGGQLEVVCKVGDDQYKKHFLGLSDNVTYFVEQIESAQSSADQYKVTFKPTTILPDVEIR